MCPQNRPEQIPAAAETTTAATAETTTETTTVELYELQRRYTLFHTSWEAPFLPHDALKQWRWLDTSLQKHEWLKVTMEESKISATPPLTPPATWRAVAGQQWAVVPGEYSDEAGWEYALDFYGDGYGEDAWWNAKMGVCHCRRRKWSCTFERTEAPALPAAVVECSAEQEAAPEEEEEEEAGQDVALTQVVDAALPDFNLEREAALLLAEDWSASNFFLDHLKLTGATELEPTPAVAGDVTCRAAGRRARRQVKARLVVPPAPMAPKTTRATINLDISCVERQEVVSKITVKSEWFLHDTPYCDSFHIREVLTFEKTPTGAVVRKGFAAIFTQRTFVRSMIESSSLSTQKAKAEPFVDFLRARGAAPAATAEEETAFEEPVDIELTQVIDTTLTNLDLRKEADLLLLEDWAASNFLLDHLAMAGATEVEVAPAVPGEITPCTEGTSRCRRQVSARLVVPPAPMAPKTTRATITYYITVKEREGETLSLRVKSDWVLHDTPYCDSFHLREELALAASPEGVKVTKGFGLIFSKRTFVKSMIESSSLSTQKAASQPFIDFMSKRAAGGKPETEEAASFEEPEDIELTRVVDTKVPGLDLTKEVELLFSEDWSATRNLLLDHLENANATEIETAPLANREVRSAGLRRVKREVSARLVVPPAPMAPKTTKATITHYITAEEKDGQVTKLSIKTDWVLLETPYCDSFHLREQLVLEAAEDGATVTKGFGLIFSKRVFVKGMIESSSLSTQKNNAQPFIDFLTRRGADGGDESGTSRTTREPLPSLLSTRTGSSKSLGSPADGEPAFVEIWELQRRPTLFHTTWQAPFLPHDGEKQWRWVDKEYRRHRWSLDSQEDSMSRAWPALTLPKCYRASSQGWTVVKSDKTDAEGWTYAVDFPLKDDMWYISPTWFHCRRRLWRLEIEDLMAGMSPTAPTLAELNETRVQRPATRSNWGRLYAMIAMMLLVAVMLLFSVVRQYMPAMPALPKITLTWEEPAPTAAARGSPAASVAEMEVCAGGAQCGSEL